jgi:hypothetical protein
MSAKIYRQRHYLAWRLETFLHEEVMQIDRNYLSIFSLAWSQSYTHSYFTTTTPALYVVDYVERVFQRRRKCFCFQNALDIVTHDRRIGSWPQSGLRLKHETDFLTNIRKVQCLLCYYQLTKVSSIEEETEWGIFDEAFCVKCLFLFRPYFLWRDHRKKTKRLEVQLVACSIQTIKPSRHPVVKVKGDTLWGRESDKNLFCAFSTNQPATLAKSCDAVSDTNRPANKPINLRVRKVKRSSKKPRNCKHLIP